MSSPYDADLDNSFPFPVNRAHSCDHPALEGASDRDSVCPSTFLRAKDFLGLRRLVAGAGRVGVEGAFRATGERRRLAQPRRTAAPGCRRISCRWGPREAEGPNGGLRGRRFGPDRMRRAGRGLLEPMDEEDMPSDRRLAGSSARPDSQPSAPNRSKVLPSVWRLAIASNALR